jgi:hypothetical protein
MILQESKFIKSLKLHSEQTTNSNQPPTKVMVECQQSATRVLANIETMLRDQAAQGAQAVNKQGTINRGGSIVTIRK